MKILTALVPAVVALSALVIPINANSEAHEDWPPRVRKVSPDGKFKTLVTFAPGQGKPEQRQ